VSGVWGSGTVRGLVAGLLMLLGASTVAALGLLAALPGHLAGSVAWRLPLLLAAAALGGRVHVDGPIAGHISALGSGGLLGPPRGSDDLTRHLTITAMPVTLTVLTAVAIGLASRRATGRTSIARTATLTGGGFAIVGLLVALSSRATVSGGSVRAGLVATPVGGAILAAASVALAGAAGSTAHPTIAAAVRAAADYGRGLLAVGVPVLVIVAAFAGVGLVGTLLVGGSLPAGLALTLGLLLAPALIAAGAALGLGMPVDMSGRLAGIQLEGTLTLFDAARAVPLLAFLPVLAAGVLLAVATRSALRGRAGGVSAQLIALGGAGVVMYAVARLGLTPSPSGGERVAVAPVWWAALGIPLAAGGLLGLLAPRVATLFAAPRPDLAIDRSRP